MYILSLRRHNGEGAWQQGGEYLLLLSLHVGEYLKLIVILQTLYLLTCMFKLSIYCCSDMLDMF